MKERRIFPLRRIYSRGMAILAPRENWELASCSSAEVTEDLEQLKSDVGKLIQCERKMDMDTYISLLTRCGRSRALLQGRQVHEYVATWGCDCIQMVLVNVIKMYGCCGSIAEARSVFDSMSQRGQFAWNAMVVAYTQNGYLQEGKCTLRKMPAHNTVSWNVLVIAYSRHGCIEEARRVFDQMPERTIISWNAMVTQYAQNGYSEQAILLFRRMDLEGIAPNPITFLAVLDACGGARDLETGRKVHLRIAATGSERNVILLSALVNMYGKCGCIQDAKAVFDAMPSRIRNRVTWNGMLAAYAQNGHSKEALDFFKLMKEQAVEPNRMTYLSLIEACSNLSAVEEAKQVHSSIIKSGLQSSVKLVTALITMYGKCGEVEMAEQVFLGSSRTDAITWTSMITAYARSGHGNQAIELLLQMDHEGIQTDRVTFISILDACSSITNLKLGKILHTTMIDEGVELDLRLATSLIAMYGKCGSTSNARAVFDAMPERNVVSWNTIVGIHAENGEPRDALELFRLMELEGEKPNRLTCTCVLLACSHAGLMEDAWYYFVSMRENYGVDVSIDHYACMADLLGRAGKLEQAEELVESMPFEPDIALWTSLLAACKTHTNIPLGVKVSRHVQRLLPHSRCAHLMLRNVFASNS